MDEPTNHLDLVSMRCVEEALAGFTGALLLVSHDERFVRDLVRTRWRITPGGYLQVSDRLPG
jgi:macrolide transport system ATP-binding/permease protein